MKRLRWAFFGVLMAACGGAQDTATTPNLAQYDDDKFASLEADRFECQV